MSFKYFHLKFTYYLNYFGKLWPWLVLMALFASVRQTWLRRNTVFLATVFGAALVTELVVDVGIDRFWDFRNRGKLWKDVEAKLVLKDEE